MYVPRAEADCERVFSYARYLVDAQRGAFSPSVFEACVGVRVNSSIALEVDKKDNDKSRTKGSAKRLTAREREGKRARN